MSGIQYLPLHWGIKPYILKLSGSGKVSRIPDHIAQGESLEFSFDLDGDDVTGWVCTINVLQFVGDTPAISRVVDATGDEWVGYLTATETAALSPTGQWRLIANLTNSTTDEAQEVVTRFTLQEPY